MHSLIGKLPFFLSARFYNYDFQSDKTWVLASSTAKPWWRQRHLLSSTMCLPNSFFKRFCFFARFMANLIPSFYFNGFDFNPQLSAQKAKGLITAPWTHLGYIKENTYKSSFGWSRNLDLEMSGLVKKHWRIIFNSCDYLIANWKTHEKNCQSRGLH